RHSSSIEIDLPNETKTIHTKSIENVQQPHFTFQQSNTGQGWKDNTIYRLKNYFPRYQLQKSGSVVQIYERPTWILCVGYGIQHVLAMFSGVIILRTSNSRLRFQQYVTN
ncbi:hypothetical protein INT47_012399, partial [Mucor saturninus]